MEPKVSIIVTVYNIEKYISQCLESIINQTYWNIEIIVVDDGSTDRSKDICLEYEKKDKRIVVISEKNSGPSAARNLGIEHATGDYIGFIDGDDYISENMYESLVNSCIKNNTKCSICNIATFFDGSKPTSNIRTIKKEYASDDLKNNFAYLLGGSQSVCNKLFRRDLFSKIRFPLHTLSEDGYVVYDLIYLAKKVSYIPLNGYYYRMKRPNSITTGTYKSGDYAIVLTNIRTYCRVKRVEPELWEDGICRVVSGGFENIQRKLTALPLLEFVKIYKELWKIQCALKYVLKDLIRSQKIEEIKKINIFLFFLNPLLFYLYVRVFYRVI